MPFASKTNTQMLSNRSRPTFLYGFRESKGGLQEGTDRRRMRDANESEIEFAAYIGIDWAEQKHACALQSSTAPGVEESELLHKPEAVEAWATELYRRFGGRPIAIALEQSRGSLLFMLLKYEPLVLFPVNPSTLVNYRKGFRPSGAKSDPSDATLLVDLLVRHRERLRQLRPDSEQTRTLQFLVEGRRKFVREKVRYGNRLTAYLKMYFPQVLDWFSAVGSPIVGDFLLRWPTLEKLQTATRDRAVIRSCSQAALSLARMLREVRAAIRSYDQDLETLTRE